MQGVIKFSIGLFLLITFNLSAHSDNTIAKANGIDICYETFGSKEDPSFLLIMGAGGQGIVWPTEFCKRLSEKGYYVIRYDQRDAGFSTCVDFDKEPYDLLDLAKDSIGLLDALAIKKAHLFGLSMGGPITELMAVHYPERVLSIAVMGAPFDYHPYILALSGLPQDEGGFSAPKESYLKDVSEVLKIAAKTDEEIIEQRMKVWQLINGPAFPFEDSFNRELQREFVARSVHPKNLQNYRKAISRSEDLVKAIHKQVKVQTVIFQGSVDPILGADHAEALARTIAGSKYYLIEGLGHLPNPHFFEFLIEKLQENANLALSNPN